MKSYVFQNFKIIDAVLAVSKKKPASKWSKLTRKGQARGKERSRGISKKRQSGTVQTKAVVWLTLGASLYTFNLDDGVRRASAAVGVYLVFSHTIRVRACKLLSSACLHDEKPAHKERGYPLLLLQLFDLASRAWICMCVRRCYVAVSQMPSSLFCCSVPLCKVEKCPATAWFRTCSLFQPSKLWQGAPRDETCAKRLQQRSRA